jgi:hypothetical protein
MPEEMTQAASSPAEVEDVFQGQQPSLDEFSHYRETGELPERFNPAEAESAPADDPEETDPEGEDPEPAPESDPEEEAQELKPKTAKRIQQLLARIKELEAPAAKQDVKTESSPVPAPQYTRPKPTADEKKPDGTPKFDSYEDFVEDLADWKAEQRIETAKREQAQQEAQKALNKTLEEARTRYEDADEVQRQRRLKKRRFPWLSKRCFRSLICSSTFAMWLAATRTN